MEKIKLIPTDSTEAEEFYVLDEAKLGGKMYLLVTDSEEGDGMALILRDDAEAGSSEIHRSDPAHRIPDPNVPFRFPYAW